MSEAWKSKNYKQFCIVRDFLAKGGWHSLRDIEQGIGFKYAQSSISARLREFQHFGLSIEKRRQRYESRKFVWQYRLVEQMRMKPYTFPVCEMLMSTRPGDCIICDRNFEELIEAAANQQSRRQDERRLADLEHQAGCDRED